MAFTRSGVRFPVPARPEGIADHSDAGWSSLVARRAHNPEVVGSNPTPATTNAERGMRNAELAGPGSLLRSNFRVPRLAFGRLAQLVERHVDIVEVTSSSLVPPIARP